MGEEEKKSKEAGKPEDHDEKKELESVKIEENKYEESKAVHPPPPPPATPPPQEIILKVYMHCEGCATKVRRCLKGFEGVEDVKTDCRTSKVVVKGDKADPLKVLERIKKKSHRQVELISPIPKPLEDPKKPKGKEEVIKSEDGIKEARHVITVVLGAYMHCEACAQEIKKRIQRMKGVESAEPDLKRSQVTVKGVFEPETLVEYVHRKTRKHAAIVATEVEKKEEEGKGAEGGEPEKKVEEGDHKEAKKAEENKDDSCGGGGEPPSKPASEVGVSELEMKRSESNHHYSAQNHEFNPQRFVPEWGAYEYPPQMFSDENPNACTVM